MDTEALLGATKDKPHERKRAPRRGEHNADAHATAPTQAGPQRHRLTHPRRAIISSACHWR